MQISIQELMQQFDAALEHQEKAMQAFIEQPSEGTSQQMNEAYQKALHIRRELKIHFSKLS